MRKVVIIGSLLVVTAWLLIMPGVVGIYLRDSVPDWLSEWSTPEEAGYKPGWFQSELHWQPEPALELRLRARHFPPLRAGWLALTGTLELPLSTQPAELRGHVGLAGGWHLHVRADDFRPLINGNIEARGLSLNVSQTGGQPQTMILRADELTLQPHRPALTDVRMRGLQRPVEDGMVRAGLEIELSDQQLGEAGLRLQAGPMDPDQLAFLFQGLGQLADSTPGSMSEGMAMMTVVGAWQEMAAGGLVIELEHLQLGDDTRFRGRWIAGQAQPVLVGSGQIDGLAAWLQRLLPGVPAGTDEARQTITAWLADLGRLEAEQSQFRFSYPPESDPPRPSR